MDAAKQSRTIAKGQFTRAEQSLKKAIELPDCPLATVERRFNDLKEKWTTVQDAHDAYTAFSETMNADDSNNLDDWIGDLVDRFEEIEISADKSVAKKRKQADKDAKSDMKPVIVQQNHAVKIERMKFPQFDGDIRRYPQFREDFDKHIHPQCQTEQLAFVLKTYLASKVREEVESCGDDYYLIWERLDQRYGNIGKLIDAILYEVKCLPYGRNDSATTLQMINIVEKAHRDLERLRAEGELCNSTTISIIEQRMPLLMKQEWVKLVASKSMESKERFKLLIELLKDAPWNKDKDWVSKPKVEFLRDIGKEREKYHTDSLEKTLKGLDN